MIILLANAKLQIIRNIHNQLFAVEIYIIDNFLRLAPILGN